MIGSLAGPLTGPPKQIWSAKLEDAKLRLDFEDGSWVLIWDDGQQCCEERYLTCDDDLRTFVGAVFLDIELSSGGVRPAEGEHYGHHYLHETAFVRISTDRGAIVLCTHNINNGYYSGFTVAVQWGGKPWPHYERIIRKEIENA